MTEPRAEEGQVEKRPQNAEVKRPCRHGHEAYGGEGRYLTWAASVGVDETSPRVQDLAAFARWLERTPSRKHRPGRNRRRASDPNVVSLAPTRSAATIDGILTAVVEFVRFLASRGWTEVTVATALSARHELRFLPPGFDRGERTERPVVNRRLVRRRGSNDHR